MVLSIRLFFCNITAASVSQCLDGHPQFPATPIGGLFLCGSGCHPGGGVMGVPGRLAAQEVISQYKKKKI
jgi:phytoene dehydrogenase-like protein